MNQERIGAFIARLRAEKNLTQKDLARRLGVTDKAVSKWENGRCMPDILLLKPLCMELDITINELLNGERDVTKDETDENLIRILKEYKQMKKVKNVLTVISIALLALLASLIVCLILGAAAIGLMSYGFVSEKPVITTDPSQYSAVIGSEAKGEYRDKWDMDESIFPEKINADMTVKDFKMVYYNPFDAQYISYLVVDYDKAAYTAEINRLKGLGIDEYQNFYGVTGFPDDQHLIAMNADPYQGFIYAITDDEDTIVYIELIFCNYFFDLTYTDYIDVVYLPSGFDATVDNPYRKEMMGE